ncbi:hypothetical protein B0A48_15157 [Cryoendolithus antarcticus]|uniref:DNA-directed RNA polymerase I subunit RPA34.5 n=1 Tax=Cryoendolithus antarcticus TaxID=1507870 RepID=A0A1V8SIX2_9PEZI|nr:hypothetical protein B0A48_15157 [Cryoendolithus antarcticus]
MAKTKVQDARIALPGGKEKTAPKASQTARAQPSTLSADVVVESGSESDSGSEGGSGDSESEQEKRQNTTKPDIRRVKVTEPTIPAVPDDTSSEEENEGMGEEAELGSSSDDELPDVAAKATSKPQKSTVTTNGAKRKADDSSSSEDEAADDPKVLPDAPPQKKSRTEAQTTAPPSLPTQPLLAPPGYTRVPTLPTSSIPRSSLAGKQIWHITAPSHLPISALTEASFEVIEKGTPVLTHKSARYSLTALPSAAATTVLLPTSEGYTPVSQPISRTLQMREVVELPELSGKQASQVTGSEKAAEIKLPAISRVREQPRGLKMRYRPPGFGKGEAGRIGSGSESEDDEAEGPMADTGKGFRKAKGGDNAIPGVNGKSEVKVPNGPHLKETRKKEKGKEKEEGKSERKAAKA